MQNSSNKRFKLLIVGACTLLSTALVFAQSNQGLDRDRNATQLKDIEWVELSERRDSTRHVESQSSSGGSFRFWNLRNWGDCEIPENDLLSAQIDEGSQCYQSGGYGDLTGTQAAEVECREQSLSSGESQHLVNEALCTEILGSKDRYTPAPRSCSVSYSECPPPPPEPMLMVYSLGSTASLRSVRLPFSGMVDLSIAWGPGGESCATRFVFNSLNTTDMPFCQYTSGGTKEIRILGQASNFGWRALASMPSGSNYNRLSRVETFGDVQGLTNLSGAFKFASTLTAVPARLPEGVTNLSHVFNGASVFNGDLSSWDVSQVTTLEQAFRNATDFNQPLNTWNILNVTDLTHTFNGARAFNQNINNWNTSNVTNMTGTFGNTNVFNQPLDQWDTSRVTVMSGMFNGASVFNQNINTWNTSSVTQISSMFNTAYQFNQPLDQWDVSRVTNFNNLFSNAHAFNQPIGNWNTSSLTGLSNTFNHARAFNQPIENWDTRNVTTLELAFSNARAFNQPLNAWDVSNVTNMRGALSYMNVFNQPLDQWNVSRVTNMSNTFEYSPVFNQDISSWCVNRISSAPSNFDRNTTAWNKTNRQPVWGTCP